MIDYRTCNKRYSQNLSVVIYFLLVVSSDTKQVKKGTNLFDYFINLFLISLKFCLFYYDSERLQTRLPSQLILSFDTQSLRSLSLAYRETNEVVLLFLLTCSFIINVRFYFDVIVVFQNKNKTFSLFLSRLSKQ